MMYTKQAEIYDSLYHFKDYAKESGYILDLVKSRLPSARTLLETACGTGRFLDHLRQHFEVEGLDLSPDMLAIARDRLPGMAIHEGDMTAFDLGKQYDVVCCLFRSIAHVRTPDGLRDAIRGMARHVRPGGLLLIEPFFRPDTFWDKHPVYNDYRSPSRNIAWMYTGVRQGDEVRLDMHFLVGGHDGVTHFTEEVRLGLFTQAQFLAAFADAGVDVEYDDKGPSGIGFYVGKLPAR